MLTQMYFFKCIKEVYMQRKIFFEEKAYRSPVKPSQSHSFVKI